LVAFGEVEEALEQRFVGKSYHGLGVLPELGWGGVKRGFECNLFSEEW
jgi:hypothetical protein